MHLVVRGTDLELGMSSYLVGRVKEEPRITVHTNANVVRLDGSERLERITVDRIGDIEAKGLFCFIGADPATTWLGSVDRDADGFVLTGVDVDAHPHADRDALGRERLPFETSLPRVFAAGDVRRGSMKRVAAAVGEGSSAVASIHRAFAG